MQQQKVEGQKCPDCNKGVIVNDEELGYWRVMKALLIAQDVIDPEAKQPRTAVHFDSAPTREGKPPTIK